MLSLDQIKENINQLKELGDPDEIQVGIHEIFYSLMCADQSFYLIYSKERPLMAPVSADQSHLYLRLFSHKELADRYAGRLEQTEVREHSILDILQIGRWALFSGGYGYILNEGDLWIGSSITDFLSLFFSRIYGDESLISSECVNTINFINEVRRNDFFCYGAVLDDDEMWTGIVQTESLPAITIQSLFHVPTDTLVIKTDEDTLTIPKESLLKGLVLCGFTEDPNAPVFESEYKNEPTVSIFCDDSWRAADPSELAITFTPIQSSASEPDLNDTVIEEGREGDEGEEIEEVPGNIGEEDAPAVERIDQPPKSTPKKKSEGFAARLLKKRRKKPHKPAVEPELPESLESSTEESSPFSDQSPFLDELDERENIRQIPEKKKKKSSRKVIIIGMVSVLLITGIGIFAAREIRYRENLKDFRTCISYQDYANAYTLYIDTDFGKDGDTILTDELDSLILRYANNEISAEELSASLEALSNFQSISQNLEIARLTASKLEESKNAYVTGRESTDIYERLNIWRQVVQLDASNYAAVQQNVNDNQLQYVNILRSDIEYYRTRSRDFAKARFDVFSYWYPNNEYVSILSREFTSDQTSTLSFYPIKIYETKIRQETNGYWTLHIGWKNMSVKTIDSIRFSVIALGEDGSVVTCEDNEGTWNIFDANDSNRYEPGEEPSSGYYWYRVFYGPGVRDVKLTAVNVTYRDGTTATYTSEADLYGLQTK